MIAQLAGTIVTHETTSLVLMVHGVGYRVAVRNVRDFTAGEEVLLHTHLAVRETALDLYGFATIDELQTFEKLLTIPKIGPKSAMAILASADQSLIRESVRKQDAPYLSKMSGIGKKTAEKVVLGLKDSFASDDSETPVRDGDYDLIEALVTMGYTPNDARVALQKLNPDITSTDERLKAVLKSIT